MTIKELIKSVASLVDEREIIDHGSVRCLCSEWAKRQIRLAEACDHVGTGLVGDCHLSDKLGDLAENDQEGGIEWDALERLEHAHRGGDVTDYLDHDAEDELIALDALIDAAREVV